MIKQITGARLLLDILAYENITDIFGYPGGALIPLFDEIYKFKKINLYLVRHEQAAAHAAEAYGKVKNTIGCCIATSGPGATNLVTGIANAYMDSNPLLCITGQVAKSAIGKMSFQEVDIVQIVKPITKKAIQVKDANDLPKLLFELINVATSKRNGPVLLDLPKDVSMQKVDGKKLLVEYQQLKKNDCKETIPINSQDINELLKLLNNSKKPVFLLGAGLIKSGCIKEIEQIIKYFKVPVVTTLHGLGIGAKTPYYYGMAGMHGSIIANKALYNADLVVSFGSRFDDRLVGNNQKFVKYGKKVHIDIDCNELGKTVNTNLKIHADLRDFVKELSKQNINIDIHSWILQLNQYRNEINNNTISYNNDYIHPYQLIDKINEYSNNAYFITDVGQHQMWCAQHLKITKACHFVSSGGAGTMGFGLPAAIGTAIAYPKKTIIALLGDGGFQMSIEELALLRQYNLNIKIFIFNNQRLGMVRQWQSLFYEKRYSSTILDFSPDFKLIASAYDLFYLKICKIEELNKIDKAFLNKAPMIIEVMIDPEENVLPMIPANESFEEIIL
jgi:acetolactate synthase-1/2/3 large subunit